jgi:hypothetical protein
MPRKSEFELNTFTTWLLKVRRGEEAVLIDVAFFPCCGTMALPRVFILARSWLQSRECSQHRTRF